MKEPQYCVCGVFNKVLLYFTANNLLAGTNFHILTQPTDSWTAKQQPAN